MLNYTKSFLKYSIFFLKYFLNSYLNRERIYSKLRILHNRDIDKIILTLKNGEGYIYLDKIYYSILEEYFAKRI